MEYKTKTVGVSHAKLLAYLTRLVKQDVLSFQAIDDRGGSGEWLVTWVKVKEKTNG